MYILQIFHSCHAPAFPAAQPMAGPSGGWGLGVPGSAAILPAAVQEMIPVCIPRLACGNGGMWLGFPVKSLEIRCWQ